jgi:hypothetical protein
MDGDLVRERPQLAREAFDALNEESHIRQSRSFGAPRAGREGIGTGVDGDRKGAGLRPGAIENVATVARAHVHEDVAERGGYPGDLTDVDVDEALAEKSTHRAMVARREPTSSRRCKGHDGQGDPYGGVAMWRVLLLASLFALLGLATVASADCTSCLTSVFVNRTTTTIDLNFIATSDDPTSLPTSVNAVVMQVDGQRTKCQNITLPKARTIDGAVVYAGTFSAYGLYSHSGRVDLGGQIYEFTVPLDGNAGTIALATDQTPLGGRGFAVQVNAVPATPHPVTVYFQDPAPATAATPPAPTLPEINPTFVIGGGLILITIVGAYIDRRRALARSLAG